MVGRKTSPRCTNCRLRKIRCDLSRPACLQCIKSKWQCPGYDTHSRFHAYKDESSSGATSTSSELSDSPCTRVQIRRRNPGVFLNVGPLSATDRLQTEFVYKITHNAVAARFVVVPEKQLLQHIPKRVGHSSALDDAIKCVCSPYPPTGAQTSDTNGSATAGKLYSRALRSLNSALSDSQESKSSETLAAATLLQMFEHSVDHVELRWVVHANGVIKMIELRGPDEMQNELDRSILGAQVGNIFFNAIRDRTNCFLADAKWVPVIQEALLGPVDKTVASNNEFSSMVLAGLSVPGVICRYERVQSLWRNQVSPCGNDDLGDAIEDIRLKLTAELQELLHVLLEWRERYEIGDAENRPTNSSQTRSSPRVRHASRLSINVFLIMTDFMLIDVIHNDAWQDNSIGRQWDGVLGQDLRQTVGQSDGLITTAKSELDALRQTDNIAALQTSALLCMMLTRVMDASSHTENWTNPLRPYVDGIFSHLRRDG